MQSVVQLRGTVNLSQTVKDTLDHLNLGRVNHCTLVPETESYRGMLTTVNDVVAFGEPSRGVLAAVLRRRAEPAEGPGPVDDDWIAEHTAYDDVDAVAGALLEEAVTLSALGLAPVLRLHPPRGGHRGIKHPVADGGQLGRHSTEEIDALLERMR